MEKKKIVITCGSASLLHTLLCTADAPNLTEDTDNDKKPDYKSKDLLLLHFQKAYAKGEVTLEEVRGFYELLGMTQEKIQYLIKRIKEALYE